jgi:hypothetical protein
MIFGWRCMGRLTGMSSITSLKTSITLLTSRRPTYLKWNFTRYKLYTYSVSWTPNHFKNKVCHLS